MTTNVTSGSKFPFEIIVVDDKPKKNIKSIIIWLSLVAFILVLILSGISPNRSASNNVVAKVSLPPYPAYNGEIIVYPDYECVCPLEITTEEGMNYYIRLHYLGAPQSEVKRRLSYSDLEPYESDIAFYVKSGETVRVNVPVGIYKFYYATGRTFYGFKELFGDSTRYYTSDELLYFRVMDNTCEGA